MRKNCKDINGNYINQFVFHEDGVVYGVVNYEGGSTNYNTTIPYSGGGDLVDITRECCEGMNFNYNGGEGKCYHREVCDVDTQLKVVFNVNENNGLVFTQGTDEECGLNLKFDYLVEYDSSKIIEQVQTYNKSVVNLIKGLRFSVLIEKYVDRETEEGVYYEDTKVLVPILEQPLYVVNNLNDDTGVILSGSSKDSVRHQLQEELGITYSPDIVDSKWLNADVLITDQDIISEIVDEEVKFSLLIKDSVMDFSIVMDNIELNKLCNKEYIERRTIDKSPSFNMVKTVDNKKSWISTQQSREYDLPIRETSYETKSDKMVINSKEIELSTSIFEAIEQDIISYLSENSQMLDGDGSSDGLWGKNLRNLLSTDIGSLKSVSKVIEALKTELVDVKSRKTLNGYPVLNAIHERYLNGEGSNQYDFSKLNDFVGMLGGYWIELIEQVIPATTLWGSTNKVGTTVFRPNKFTYKKYNLHYSNIIDSDSIASKSGVEVIAQEITQAHPTPETKNNVFIYNYSNGSERLGKVSILGSNGDNTTNNINAG
jgi:hypothetical protein